MDRVRSHEKRRPLPVSDFTLLPLNIVSCPNRYGMHYHGQMALQISLLVAFTQLIPEHQVQVFGVIKARVKVWILFGNAQTVLIISLNFVEFANGIFDLIHYPMFRWLPVSMDHNPVWMVRGLGLSPILQKEPRGDRWRI